MVNDNNLTRFSDLTDDECYRLLCYVGNLEVKIKVALGILDGSRPVVGHIPGRAPIVRTAESFLQQAVEDIDWSEEKHWRKKGAPKPPC